MNLNFAKLNNPTDAKVLVSIVRTYPEFDSDLEKLNLRYQQEISEAENRAIFTVSEETGICVGFGQLILKNADNDPTLANGVDIAHVHDLRIRSEFQGRGFGKTFMYFLEKTAFAMNVRILTLGVDNWNNRAIGLYKSLGYLKFKEAQGRTEDEKVFYLKKVLQGGF